MESAEPDAIRPDHQSTKKVPGTSEKEVRQLQALTWFMVASSKGQKRLGSLPSCSPAGCDTLKNNPAIPLTLPFLYSSVLYNAVIHSSHHYTRALWSLSLLILSRPL